MNILDSLFAQLGLTYTVILFCALSFLIGSLPFGLWIGLLKGVDIRTVGSKNIGATNVLRVLGPGPGSLAFLLDVGKGVVGVALARELTHHIFWIPGVYSIPDGLYGLQMPHLVLIGLCAVLGHTFSPFLRFKGGKGIATTLGILIALSWPVAVVGFSTWVIFVALTRYVSLSSLLAAISLPIASYLILHGEARTWMIGMTAVLFVLVTIRHRANIQRLLNGTESKFGQRAASPVEPPAPAPSSDEVSS